MMDKRKEKLEKIYFCNINGNSMIVQGFRLAILLTLVRVLSASVPLPPGIPSASPHAALAQFSFRLRRPEALELHDAHYQHSTNIPLRPLHIPLLLGHNVLLNTGLPFLESFFSSSSSTRAGQGQHAWPRPGRHSTTRLPVIV